MLIVPLPFDALPINQPYTHKYEYIYIYMNKYILINKGISISIYIYK